MAGQTVLEPSVLDVPEVLSHFDRNHIAIYEADEIPFQHRPRWLNSSEIRYVSFLVCALINQKRFNLIFL